MTKAYAVGTKKKSKRWFFWAPNTCLNWWIRKYLQFKHKTFMLFFQAKTQEEKPVVEEVYHVTSL